MQFESIAMTGFALAVLFFLFIRRRVITGQQEEIAALSERLYSLGNVAANQRTEIEALMATAQAERRARQMSTLTHQQPPVAPPRPAGPTTAQQQEKATRHRAEQSSSANKWDDTTHLNSSHGNVVHLGQSIEQSRAGLAQPRELVGNGGTFDGGGASGDYGRSESSCSSSSSSSSDSGSSSSSSDSGSSCSSSD